MGKKVSFEIATNGVEGPTHRTELTSWHRTKQNKVQADLDTKNGPLGQLEDKAKKGNGTIKQGENDKVDPTNTPKAKDLDYVNYTDASEPSSYEEAIVLPDAKPWLQAMKSEMD